MLSEIAQPSHLATASQMLMPLTQFALLATFMAAMIGSPGPANMALVASGLAFGVRPVLPFMLGTMSGFQMIFWLNALGLFALLQSAPAVFQILRWLCIGYILYLAWLIVRARPKTTQAGAAPGFWRGFWVHPLNPKAYAMQVAALSQFVSADRFLSDAMVVSITSLLLGSVLNSLWLCGGSLMRASTGDGRILRGLNIALAALMVGSTITSLQMIPG
ncbi:LysE family translocator [Stappia taiwanensis]|uniref:LysE family translocator n=1 Tax=Stappia taiwanensis TaxID=992267 RepID=A0A838XJA3_9HYPH|nr:LysE family translocator [Stappia taiwanensis]MBA4610202.1 LysE family translocator [Stappia taiwanensis]GGE77720.1 protein AmbA [Stappia taiwanensis]